MAKIHWITLSCVAIVACGGPTRVTLPIDSDKQASELTETEIRDICKESLGAVKRAYGSDICSAMGLAQSLSGQGSCTAVRDECLGRFDPSQCDKGEVKPIACDVTIGEIETCMNDTLALVDDLPSIHCGMGMEDLQRLASSNLNVSTPASCMAVEEKCGDEFRIDIGVSQSTSSSVPLSR